MPHALLKSFVPLMIRTNRSNPINCLQGVTELHNAGSINVSGAQHPNTMDEDLNMGMDVVCPQCGQLIRNAVANAANKIKCGACGHAFSVSRGDANVAAAETTRVQAAQDEPRTREGSLKVFGAGAVSETTAPLREPPAANYGLLSAAAWIGLIVGAALAGADFYMNGNQSLGFTTNTWSHPTFVMAGISRALMLVMSVTTGLVFVKIAERLTRIDRFAALLAWRKSKETFVLQELKGSSLPYMLPPMVIGGVMLIVGLLIISGDRLLVVSDETVSSIIGALCWSVAGIGIFAMGLAFSELRRLLWRMSQFGAAIPHEPVWTSSLAAPASIQAPLRGSHLVFSTIVLISIGAFTSNIREYSYDSQNWLAVGSILLGALAIYSSYRISLLIDAACAAWSRPNAETSTVGAKILRTTLWIMLAGMVVFLNHAGMIPPVSLVLFLAGAVVTLLLYAVRVKVQLDRWVQRVSDLAGTRRRMSDGGGDRLALYACVCALLCCMARIGGQFEEYTTRGPDIVAAVLGTLILAAAPSWLAAWFGFVLHDLAKIESHLREATAEEPKRATVPATSAPAAPVQPAPASV